MTINYYKKILFVLVSICVIGIVGYGNDGDGVSQLSSTTVFIPMTSGWNLISLPLEPNDGIASRKQIKSADVWSWISGDYASVAALHAKAGYWINLDNTIELTIKGTAANPMTTLTSGWNLIGPLHNFQRPQSSYVKGTIWTWDGSQYQAADNLEVKRGYWLYVTDNVKMDMLTGSTNSKITITEPEDLSLINNRNVTVIGTVDGNMTSVTVNGESAAIANGKFSISGLVLGEGENKIMASAKDSFNNRFSTRIKVSIDSIAPKIVIDDLDANILVANNSIPISGTVDDSSSDVSVNGKDAVVDNGLFVVSNINLKDGDNSVIASAVDAAGNIGTAGITINVSDIASIVTEDGGSESNVVPTIANITIATAVTVGQNFSVSVSASGDTSAAIALLDFRPQVAYLARFPLTFDGTEWSVDTMLPAIAFPNGVDQFDIAVKILVFNDARERNEQTRSTTVKKAPDIPLSLSIAAPADNSLVGTEMISVSGNVNDVNATIEINNSPVINNNGIFAIVDLQLQEGENTITTVARDVDGNIETVRVIVTLDTTNPDIAVTGIVNNQITSRDINPNIVITDLHPAMSSILLNGNSYAPGTLITAEGDYILEITANDQVSNSALRTINFAIDKTPPVIVVSDPVINSQTSSLIVDVSGTVTDLHLQEIKINGVITTIVAGNFSERVSLLSEGSNAITITATDAALLNSSVIHPVIRDTTGPQLRIDGPVDNSTTNQSTVSVIGSVDVSASTVVINGNNTAINNGIFDVDLGLLQGANIISVTSADQLGNETSQQIVVNLDSIAPNISGITPGDGFKTRQDTATIIGDVDDPTADLTINGDIVALGGDGSFNYLVNLTEGTNPITLNVVDNVGNTRSSSLSLIRDSDIPQISITSPASDITTNQNSITVMGTVNDANASVTINNQPVNNDSGSFTYILDMTTRPSGPVPVNAIAVDDVGNSAETSINIVRDVDAPDINFLTPVDNALLNQNFVLILGNINDSDATVTVNGQSATVTESRFEISDFSVVEGTNVLNAVAVDAIGNQSSPISLTVIIDITAPELPQLLSPPAYINSDRVMLSGTAEPLAKLAVSGGLTPLELNVENDGSFQFTSLLNVNSTTILRIKATDLAGNVGNSTTHMVTSDTIPPEIILTSPEENSVSQLKSIATFGVVEDANPIAQILVEGQQAIVNSDNTFSSVLDLDNGLQQSINVIAEDIAGNTGSKTVTIDIVDDGVDDDPPVVSIVSPPFDGLVPSETITVIARVLDQSVITEISVNSVVLDPLNNFLDGNQLTFTVTVDENGEFEMLVTSEPSTSARQARSVVDRITHRVIVDDIPPEPPVVNIITPSSHTNGDVITVYGSGEPHASLTVTGGLQNVTVEIPETGSYIINVPLRFNQVNDLVLTAADLVNNISQPTSAPTIHDNVSPEIMSITPESNSSNIPFESTIEIRFNEPMNNDSVNAINILVNDFSVAFSLILTDNNTVARLDPNQAFPDSAIVTIVMPTTLTDIASNPLANAVVSKFVVQDLTPPAIPVLNTFPELTNENQVEMSGSAEPLSTILVDNGAQVFMTNADGQGNFSLDIVMLANQTNSLTIQARDPSNNLSSVVNAVINHDNIQPEFVQSVPQNNGENITINSSVLLTFSEPLLETTISGISLNTVEQNAVEVTASLSAANIISIIPVNPLMGQQQYTVDIPDSITDLADNSLVENRSVTFRTTDDVPPNAPIIDLIDPASPTNQNQVLISGFAEPNSTLRIVGGLSPISQIIDTTGQYSISVPLNPDAENNLQLSVTDSSGNESQTISRIVLQDSESPHIVSSTPGQDDIITVNRSIFIEFSEAINDASILSNTPSIRILDEFNQAVPGQLSISSTGRSVTFFPVQNLLPNKEYGIIIDTGIQDLAGNNLEATVTIDFMTSELVAINRPAAPQLIPVPPELTSATVVVLTGTAQANSEIHVSGALEPVSGTVNPDGSFSISINLRLRQDNYLLLYVISDGITGDILTTKITHTDISPGIRIKSPKANVVYHNRSVTVMGIIDIKDRVSNILVNGEPAARFGLYFARQILLDEAGQHTVTVSADVDEGSASVSDTVNFSFDPDPEGVDTKAPVVTIIFPEFDEIFNSSILELMLTVEEGGSLAGVFSNEVTPHNQVGNIFFIYHELKNQGDNVVTVQATDAVGLTGADSVTVFLDDTNPAAPVLDEIPAITDQRLFTLSGTAEPNIGIKVEGGLSPVIDFADASGNFTINVPLIPNSTTKLTITAVDSAGNLSDEIERFIIHDDTRPSIVHTTPAPGDAGVPVDQRITIIFSEEINESSVTGETNFNIVDSENNAIPGNIIFSADGTRMTFIPSFKFQRNGRIKVILGENISDVNGFTLGEQVTFFFDTALFITTLSGVVVDPELQPLEGIRIGIQGTDISQTTSSFGTFILDEVPLGSQILAVDGRPDPDTGMSPTGDNRRFGLLEFEINIVEDTDNSLGRPIFMVPVDFSTTQQISSQEAVIAFNSLQHDIDGFSVFYETGAARFENGTSNGNIIATRIEPAYIPDRLPSGAIPHFMVAIGPDDLSFNPPASMTFKDVYNLNQGDEVSLFHFKYGIHNFVELGTATVDENGVITTDPVLIDSGFVGFVPTDPAFDLSRIYLHGRVVDTSGNGLPGIFVNAIAGFTVAVTDENGEYRIPMPELRLFLIRTFALISTSLGATDAANPLLVFQSDLTELSPSGITEMPDIVVNIFFLGGNIRFVNDAGEKVPRTGLGYDNGVLTAVDESTVRATNIYIYRQHISADGTIAWDSIPFSRTQASLDPFQLGFDAGFSLSFAGADANENDGNVVNTMVPRPGDILKVVALNNVTGYYGETDIRISALADQTSGMTNLDMFTNLDVRPAHVIVDVNRVFSINGIRRRANIPHSGIALTNDEYVEIKTVWTTPGVTPLDRAELQLRGRLKINSINFQEDIFFTVQGGEHARILEIREALFPPRLDILQQETDVGTETLTISPNGSFSANSLLPLHIRTDSYGLQGIDQANLLSVTQEMVFNILDLNIEPADDADFQASGRFLPDETIAIGPHTIVTGPDGVFSVGLDSVPESGIGVKIGSGVTIPVGASFTPIIDSIAPQQGSQGDSITITGVNFSPIATQNKVRFNGAPAIVELADETTLRVRVPNEASSGDITVTVAGQTSNGIFFDFISDGINNGSFEDASLRGFVLTGDGEIVKQIINIIPTDRTYMAFIHTGNDPRDGNASLATDRFFVPVNSPFLVFDFNFLGTLIFNDVKDYISIYIVEGETETQLTDIIPADLTKIPYSVVSGYDIGTGFQTAIVDLANYAGSGVPIRFRIQLQGRGAYPARIPDLRPDDDNPLEITKQPGTALLLDNFYVTANSLLPLPINEGDLMISNPTADRIGISGQTGAIGNDGKLIVWGIQSGDVYDVDSDDFGSFFIDIPKADGTATTCLGLSYSTVKTTTDNTSDRLFSPTLILKITNQ